MDIILLERVEKLGNLGDVVKVKPGYARNFLLPKGKALRATESNRKRFETERGERENANAQRRTGAQGAATKVADASCIVIRQASESLQLYGSVTARDVAVALTEGGANVSRHQVILDRAIKTLGLHRVRVALHPEVIIQVTVNVARSVDEAATQTRTGLAGGGPQVPEETAGTTTEDEGEDDDASSEPAAS
ncbi:MAG: 50S ribosomal protein L9 [Alphaproteobacteria bacterium]|nr:50S ribosomal protein L9 [Alphaproteobacteria bacterium]